MENSKLNFKNGNPGAVQFGNFINYYQFHPPENRLKLLPQNIWAKDNFYALDLGCNAGDLTISLYNFLTNHVKNCKILGVDIDQTLIDRAQEKNNFKEQIEFICIDLMDVNSNAIQEYLAIHKISKFDAVFCFSLTMWIHLNHGDEGLKTFLKNICTLGEVIVIEPQPWKCYRTAVKRFKLTNNEFPYFKLLTIRNNVEQEIEDFLIESCNMKKIFESERTKWERKLLIFQKIN